MLSATKTSTNEKVYAWLINREDKPFSCPECGDEVILKKGIVKVHHFAHKPPTSCEFGQGESEKHRACKLEIYERLLFDNLTHTSPASLGEEAFKRTIVVNGCSKTYSMTGWRIGYIGCPDKELVAAMGRLQDQSTSNPTSIAQKAATAALNGDQDEVEVMRQAFEKRRNIIVTLLNGIPGFECRNPGGAFYAFPNVSGLYGKHFGDKVMSNSDDFAAYLLEEARVAVVPGSGFGADDYIRLSYATSEKNIEEGLARIGAAVSKLS